MVHPVSEFISKEDVENVFTGSRIKQMAFELMELMEGWQLWMTAGISLIILETLIPGFVIAGIGIACLASGLASYFEMGYAVQGFILFGVTMLFFITLRPLFVNLLYASSNTRTNIDALIGKTGVVIFQINPRLRNGRVLVDGEDWKGISEETHPIKKNERVEILRVSGTKLIVKRKRGD